MAMTREEFVALLTPERMKFVWESIHGGLADYADPTNYSAVARIDHTTSVRAAIRNCHIVGRAKRAIAANPHLGVRHVRKRSRDLFYLADRARISLQKLDKNLRSSNYPTRQATDFNAQQWPNDTPEIVVQMSLWSNDVAPQEMTNVIAGYVANAAETEFEVHVTCPDGSGYTWTLRLNAEQIAELVTKPAVAVAEVTKQVQKRRVHIRPGVTKKQGTDGSVE